MKAALACLVVIVGCSGKAIVDGAGGASSTSTGGKTTSSTGASFGTCSLPGSCTLTHPGCCPTCGTQTLSSLVPVAKDQVDAFHEAECPEGGACPACESCPKGPLFSYCEGNACIAKDLRTHTFSTCATNADCKLRYGTDCFEPCTSGIECSGLVAINRIFETNLTSLVCAKDEPPPPPCAPTYPDNASAECLSGRCEVVILE